MKRFMVLALVICSIGLIVAQAPSNHELLNQDHYQAEWTHFAGGEPAKTMLLNMIREAEPEEKHPNK